MSHQIREVEAKEKDARQKIIDFANHFGMEILFKSDVEAGRDSLKLKWHNGDHAIYTVKVIPTLINDNTTISLDSRMTMTYHKPPSLNIEDGLD